MFRSRGEIACPPRFSAGCSSIGASYRRADFPSPASDAQIGSSFLTQGRTMQGWQGGFRGGWLRDGILLSAAVAVGCWAHGDRQVHAASSDLQFQMEADALLLYSPGEHTIYVYKGATGGNSHIQCSYKYVIGSAGEGIERRNCDMGSLYH